MSADEILAIARQGVGDEAVVTGIAHRGVEKAVDDQRAGGFVHLVLDWLAAHGNLHDDVHFMWGGLANRQGIQLHRQTPGTGSNGIIPATINYRAS